MHMDASRNTRKNIGWMQQRRKGVVKRDLLQVKGQNETGTPSGLNSITDRYPE